MRQSKNYKEYTIESYLKHRNLESKELKNKSFWKNLPKNHQALMCMEGMLYGFLIREE